MRNTDANGFKGLGTPGFPPCLNTSFLKFFCHTYSAQRGIENFHLHVFKCLPPPTPQEHSSLFRDLEIIYILNSLNLVSFSRSNLKNQQLHIVHTCTTSVFYGAGQRRGFPAIPATAGLTDQLKWGCRVSSPTATPVPTLGTYSLTSQNVGTAVIWSFPETSLWGSERI